MAAFDCRRRSVARRWEVRRDSCCGAMDGSEGRRSTRLESDEREVSRDRESEGIGAIAKTTTSGLQVVDELDLSI